jgi:recombination protein RecA
VGARSSGRTSLLHALLAASTGRGEFAALVDAGDAFDPCSAAAAGVELSRLVWVRCGGQRPSASEKVEPAMRAADLLIQAGGFGVVALDLADAAPRQLQRIPATAWFRFRRAVETTPTILAVLADRPLARSCASLAVKLPARRAEFTGRAPFLLLRGFLSDAG